MYSEQQQCNKLLTNALNAEDWDSLDLILKMMNDFEPGQTVSILTVGNDGDASLVSLVDKLDSSQWRERRIKEEFTAMVNSFPKADQQILHKKKPGMMSRFKRWFKRSCTEWHHAWRAQTSPLPSFSGQEKLDPQALFDLFCSNSSGGQRKSWDHYVTYKALSHSISQANLKAVIPWVVHSAVQSEITTQALLKDCLKKIRTCQPKTPEHEFYAVLFEKTYKAWARKFNLDLDRWYRYNTEVGIWIGCVGLEVLLALLNLGGLYFSVFCLLLLSLPAEAYYISTKSSLDIREDFGAAEMKAKLYRPGVTLGYRLFQDVVSLLFYAMVKFKPGLEKIRQVSGLCINHLCVAWRAFATWFGSFVSVGLVKLKLDQLTSLALLPLYLMGWLTTGLSLGLSRMNQAWQNCKQGLGSGCMNFFGAKRAGDEPVSSGELSSEKQPSVKPSGGVEDLGLDSACRSEHKTGLSM